jgi:hypothetical protein
MPGFKVPTALSNRANAAMCQRVMSALGQTRKWKPVCVMSAFPLEADTSPCPNDVGLVPNTDIDELVIRTSGKRIL